MSRSFQFVIYFNAKKAAKLVHTYMMSHISMPYTHLPRIFLYVFRYSVFYKKSIRTSQHLRTVILLKSIQVCPSLVSLVFVFCFFF